MTALRFPRLLQLTLRHAFAIAIVALAVVIQIEVLRGPGMSQLSLAALLATLPLLLWRTHPLAAPLFVSATLAFVAIVDPQPLYDTGAFFFTLLLASIVAGGHPDRRRAYVGLASVVALGAFVTWRFPEQSVGDYFWVTFLVAAVWVVGSVLRHRAEQVRQAEERARLLEEHREDQAREAVAEERARIARELHDVVAHSVSVMTVQAAGVRRLLLPEQQREREALRTVEETGRQALVEMRRMLGVLRQANEQPELSPQPGLATLETLVGQVRDAGLPVEVRVEGEPYELPAGVDLSAYRIVQEALTNALRHAGPARASVVVRYDPGALEVEVLNDGRADEAGDGSGRGLAGMRERVAVYGGTLESGPAARGGFAVRARIPAPEGSETWASAS